MKRIREQVIFIRLPKAKAKFRAGLKKRDIKLIRDVSTRWNSTYAMMSSAHMLRVEIGEFLAVQKGQIGHSMLNPDEWTQVDSLAKFMEPLDQSTRACGGGNYATLHLGIPHFNILSTHFNSTIQNRQTV